MRLSSKFSAERGKNTGAKPSDDGADHRPRQNDLTPSPAAKNLALAHHLERLIERGVIADYTEAARRLHVSQPRMTHLMGLVLLAPRIQEAILLGKVAPKDKDLRDLARIAEWQAQIDRQTQRRLHDDSEATRSALIEHINPPHERT